MRTQLAALRAFAICLAVGASSVLAAQSAPDPSEKAPSRIIFRRPLLKKTADLGDIPTNGIKSVVAERDFGEEDGAQLPPDEEFDADVDEVPPPEEPEEEPPQEDEPPTFFGEPIEGNFVLCLDRSGSMYSKDSGSGPIEDGNGGSITNPSRIQIVKVESVRVLSNLTNDNEFAIVTFGGNPEWTWYQNRVDATQGNVAAAINEIQSMQAFGATPAYSALKRCCEHYNQGSGLDQFFFLCDGVPNQDSGAPGGSGNAGIILSDFPQWWQSGPGGDGCKLICVHVGDDRQAGQFMHQLANLTGGVFVKK